MTITLQWWWCLPLAITLVVTFRDVSSFSGDYPWLFWGYPLAAGILLGHFL